MSVVWEEPPARVRNQGPWRGAWRPEAEKLRSRPGEWARLAELPNERAAGSLAYNIRRGGLKAFKPAGSFEARSSKCYVWARYVGGDQA